MGEGNSLNIVNGRDIYGTTLKFIDERLVVIGTHGGPATVLHVGVENGY